MMSGHGLERVRLVSLLDQLIIKDASNVDSVMETTK
jgi:hypothetical protein